MKTKGGREISGRKGILGGKYWEWKWDRVVEKIKRAHDYDGT